VVTEDASVRIGGAEKSCESLWAFSVV
jgi:hypothetical protein